jgi:hypothetical protein
MRVQSIFPQKKLDFVFSVFGYIVLKHPLSDFSNYFNKYTISKQNCQAKIMNLLLNYHQLGKSNA